MKNVFNFCSKVDFSFVIEYLAHEDINIHEIDDIDVLYDKVIESFNQFETSPYYLQDTSHLQAVKDFLNDTRWNI